VRVVRRRVVGVGFVVVVDDDDDIGSIQVMRMIFCPENTLFRRSF